MGSGSHRVARAAPGLRVIREEEEEYLHGLCSEDAGMSEGSTGMTRQSNQQKVEAMAMAMAMMMMMMMDRDDRWEYNQYM